jgi:hypothetical protein
MTYELAKELKDAGFPQEKTIWTCDNEQSYPRFYYGEPDAQQVAEPTLSELIEACGRKTTIHLMVNPNGTASAWVTEMDIPTAAGSTLDEAVARLWFALNKN